MRFLLILVNSEVRATWEFEGRWSSKLDAQRAAVIVDERSG